MMIFPICAAEFYMQNTNTHTHQRTYQPPPTSLPGLLHSSWLIELHHPPFDHIILTPPCHDKVHIDHRNIKLTRQFRHTTSQLAKESSNTLPMKHQKYRQLALKSIINAQPPAPHIHAQTEHPRFEPTSKIHVKKLSKAQLTHQTNQDPK